MAHATRALQSHDLSGEGIKLWLTYILFWPHKDTEGLPGWVISPMPGPPPKQHKHERQYTPNTHSVSHPNKANMEWWIRRLFFIFGGLGGPKVSWHLSYMWGKPPKKHHPGNLFRPGIEPGPAAGQARMLPLGPQRWTTLFSLILFLQFSSYPSLIK